MGTKHLQNIGECFGIDLKSNERSQDPRFLSGGQNARMNSDREWLKRLGFQSAVYPNRCHFGIWLYEGTDMLGTAKKEIVGVGEHGFYRMVEKTYTITNSDGSNDATLSILPDGNGGINFKITRNSVDIVDEDLGTGEEASFTSIEELRVIVDAVSNLSMAFGFEFTASDVDATYDTINESAHGLLHGMPVQFTSGGTLPGGINAATTYYVHIPHTDDVSIATDHGNARNDTASIKALTASGSGTHRCYPHHPAAFSEFIESETIEAGGGTYDVKYWVWEHVDVGAYSGLAGDIGSDTFQNCSAALVNGALYVTSYGETDKQRYVMKYDGHRFHRSGLPKGSAPTAVASSALSTSPNTDVRGSGLTLTTPLTTSGSGFNYQITYVAIDKLGQVIESEARNYSDYRITAASEYVYLTFIGIEDEYQFNQSGSTDYYPYTDYAFVNGTQSSVTTIDVGLAGGKHCIRSGDILFFYDENQGRFIAREVTSTTKSTITISEDSLEKNQTSPNYDAGGAVDVQDYAVLAQNTRIAIWRTIDGGSEFYLLDEIPECSRNYFDETTDANLGALYVAPIVGRLDPPEALYLCQYNDSTLVAADKKTVYWSEPGFPEYWNAGRRSLIPNHGQELKGIKQGGDFLHIFGETITDVAVGDLSSAFRIERLSNEVGCTSHDAIESFDEATLVWPSQKGPYRTVYGRDLAPLGAAPRDPTASRLEPFFTDDYSAETYKPRFQRATAAVLPTEGLYVLHIPYERDTSLGNSHEDYTATFVYDRLKDAWYPKWTNIDAAAGICQMDGRLYWTSRKYDGSGSSSDLDNSICRTSRQLKTDIGDSCYWDHEEAINGYLDLAWHTEGSPRTFKKFLRAWIEVAISATSWALTFTSYDNWDDSTTRTSASRTVSSQDAVEIKLKSGKAKSMKLRLRNSVGGATFRIIGWTIEIAHSFRRPRQR